MTVTTEKPQNMFKFTLQNPVSAAAGPRLGCISRAGKQAIATPSWVPVTSRGAMPHLTPDVIRDHTAIRSVYAGLEDCICH